ncbi:MAG TPA: TIM barrel protein, partial [Acidobacteriaceae bacterium]|nr:TIM barrel protein [Acidobacteriaceae bacterium]
TVGFSALAGAGAQWLGSTTDAQSSAAAGTDVSQMPRLLSGCCAYSYDHALRKGTMKMEDFIHKAVELRVDGIDMTAYYLKSTDPEYLDGLRHLAYKNAMPLSGSACGVSMVQADPSKRAESLTEIKKWVDVTDRLGASHLRVFAGELPSGATLQQGVDWTVETMKAATDYSGKKGIMLGLEDHSGVTQRADVCLEIMRRVNSPYAGINLDVTNFIPTPTQDVYAQIEACIPYATNTHIRDRFEYNQSPVDLDRVWKLFAQAGFKGYMSAEYEGPDSDTGVPKLVAQIRTLCQKYSTV